MSVPTTHYYLGQILLRKIIDDTLNDDIARQLNNLSWVGIITFCSRPAGQAILLLRDFWAFLLLNDLTPMTTCTEDNNNANPVNGSPQISFLSIHSNFSFPVNQHTQLVTKCLTSCFLRNDHTIINQSCRVWLRRSWHEWRHHRVIYIFIQTYERGVPSGQRCWPRPSPRSASSTRRRREQTKVCGRRNDATHATRRCNVAVAEQLWKTKGYECTRQEGLAVVVVVVVWRRRRESEFIRSEPVLRTANGDDSKSSPATQETMTEAKARNRFLATDWVSRPLRENPSRQSRC